MDDILYLYVGNDHGMLVELSQAGFPPESVLDDEGRPRLRIRLNRMGAVALTAYLQQRSSLWPSTDAQAIRLSARLMQFAKVTR